LITLKNILDLVDAVLHSHPVVEHFGKLTIHPNRVMQGDAYLAKSRLQSDIDTALARGAYAIIYDIDAPVVDSEIAWIRVDDAWIAEQKLLRFWLLSYVTEAFYTDIYTLGYLQQLNSHPDILILDAPLAHLSHRFWALQSPKTILGMGSDRDFETLFPAAKALPSSPSLDAKPLSTLEVVLEHHRIKLPWVLLDAFSQAVEFLRSYESLIPWEKIGYLATFEPISVTAKLKSVEFGKGSKTLVCMHDATYLDAFLSAIKTLAPWLKIVIFLPKSHELSYNGALYYEDREILDRRLLETPFDYALLPFVSRNTLHFLHTPQQDRTPTLFDLGFTI